MLVITYLNAAQQPIALTYASYEEFERSQMTCSTPLADHYKVTQVTLNGHPIDYTGPFGDLYFHLLALDKEQYNR